MVSRAPPLPGAEAPAPGPPRDPAPGRAEDPRRPRRPRRAVGWRWRGALAAGLAVWGAHRGGLAGAGAGGALVQAAGVVSGSGPDAAAEGNTGGVRNQGSVHAHAHNVHAVPPVHAAKRADGLLADLSRSALAGEEASAARSRPPPRCCAPGASGAECAAGEECAPGWGAEHAHEHAADGAGAGGERRGPGPVARAVLGEGTNRMLGEMRNVSDSEVRMERTFLSPASLRAAALASKWMEEAGMRTWMDGVGNVHGRLDGTDPAAPALLLGSHIDTVIDGGNYDGIMGVVTAISVVQALTAQYGPERLRHPVEVIAFSDEEGVRFHSTFLGSRGISGTFVEHGYLDAKDKNGFTVRSVLDAVGLGGTEASVAAVAMRPEEVAGFIEVHIEQGPVLEDLGLPLGVVSAIAGQSRLAVTLAGEQGHAGTVPMASRKDALGAAAEAVLAVERLCGGGPALQGSPRAQALHSEGLVCTVGELDLQPGASNVIPGHVYLTVDIRAKSDALRDRTTADVTRAVEELCAARGVACTVEQKHSAAAASCDPGLTGRLQRAVGRALADEALRGDLQLGPRNATAAGSALAAEEVPVMVSGAGHDALALKDLTEIGMLFVRCRGGVSHSPLEHVEPADVAAAATALFYFLEESLLED